MAQRIFTLGKQGEGKDLGELATRIFANTEVAVTVPDAGATPEETWANILASCGGDHVNARNIFTSQSAFLTKQKHIKETAKILALRVALGNGETLNEAQQKQLDAQPEAERSPMTLDEAKIILAGIGGDVMPKHTPRGEGEATPRATSIKKAVDNEKARQVKDTQAMLAGLPEAIRSQALENLRNSNPELHKALTEGETAAPATEEAPATETRKRR